MRILITVVSTAAVVAIVVGCSGHPNASVMSESRTRTMEQTAPRPIPPYTPNTEAEEIALDYVARTYNASILNCHILAIEAVIMDQVTNEVITICTVAVDKPVFEVYKIVVDSEDTAFPISKISLF